MAVDHRKRDAREVGEMFSKISPRYDLLNHILSLGLDRGWRRRVAEATGGIQCRRILDVCTGTGDMAIELGRYRKDAEIEGLDFSRKLMDMGERKTRKEGLDSRITFRQGNAEELPYDDCRFDAVTITFGLRNIKDRKKALQEFNRVTRHGGCFLCLEFSRPEVPLLSLIHSFYLTRVVPPVSRLFGSDPSAYRYLARTIKEFPSPKELSVLIASAEWQNVSCERMSFGAVALHKGIKG
jgi:demethylmenaquinone methyltransferase / 2-methoxy-6-polyprenyl-1,4-benzoquinol methylase